MNERIQELARQAGILIDWGEDIKVGRWGIGGKYENMQKFAELIVRECCELLKDSGESWEQFSRNPPQGQAHNASGALFAAYRLKEDAVDMLEEHFGVES
jgi:glycerol-3-phosphate dehydrogenase